MPQPPALWLGHATTRSASVAGSAIVIDPFRTKNPRMPAEYRDLKAVGKVDLILVTHGQSGLIATDQRWMGSAGIASGTGRARRPPAIESWSGQTTSCDRHLPMVAQ